MRETARPDYVTYEEYLRAYRNLPGLKAYLIVYQDEVRVEHF